MSLPAGHPFVSTDLGVDKLAIVKDALTRSNTVAFAGDGRPDLAPALLVKPELRFAKGWLANKLDSLGEHYTTFNVWSEIAQKLIGEK